MSQPAPAAAGGDTINLSLVSHTNVGKTTLMRTLTRQDIGEVADRPHVTEEAESYVLIDTPQGDALRLWDTPGFGDSARLLKRLRANANPIGWLLTQVWDRFADRPFFCSQRAVRNVRDESDVVLYLVNAAEEPSSAGYVEKEIEILGWIGKPVVVLLNQMGPARGKEAEAAEEALWTRHLAAHVGSREAIALDAFARCWVQEDRLLGVVSRVLPEEKRQS
ncbi:MAG TPA: GTPase domain-containing protein, partial [Burkholderiales bacterium]|nr:GTPase domain-containing protein [Burkholderiales bacterium]